MEQEANKLFLRDVFEEQWCVLCPLFSAMCVSLKTGRVFGKKGCSEKFGWADVANSCVTTLDKERTLSPGFIGLTRN